MINTKVKGISPDLNVVKEARRINKNTIPLAPKRPVLKNMAFNKPVTNAVVRININKR